jgi:hypothetical protein
MCLQSLLSLLLFRCVRHASGYHTHTMPPRRSARVAAVVERATTALAPLPIPIVLHIFGLLSVDCRLRCAEVCRGWRTVLAERSLWTRLDLTAESGVHLPSGWRDALDALLRCAAARAGGSLQALHINCSVVTHEALLEVAAANAGALRELHAHADLTTEDLGLNAAQAAALLAAAPLLRVFATDLYSGYADAEATRRALRHEAPFAPLRVRNVGADLSNEDEADVVALAADVAAHAFVRGATLYNGPLDDAVALDAVVDAALARRMQTVALQLCNLVPASAPALARLLSSDALMKLECTRMDLLNAPAAAVLAAALRANSTLTSLTLDCVGVFTDVAAGAELLGALTGHVSLRVLNLTENIMVAAQQAAAGAALGALLAANAPALTELDVSWCRLRDDGLRALFEALPCNTHLRSLYVPYNYISEAFARGVLLPAVRANSSLRTLRTGADVESAADAERIVNSRFAA